MISGVTLTISPHLSLFYDSQMPQGQNVFANTFKSVLCHHIHCVQCEVTYNVKPHPPVMLYHWESNTLNFILDHPDYDGYQDWKQLM